MIPRAHIQSLEGSEKPLHSSEHLLLFQKTQVWLPVAMLDSLLLPVTPAPEHLVPSPRLWHLHRCEHSRHRLSCTYAHNHSNERAMHGGSCLVSQHRGGGNRWTPGSHWPASLAESGSSRLVREPLSKPKVASLKEQPL